MTEETSSNKDLKLCECGRCNEWIPIINKRGDKARFKGGHNAYGQFREHSPRWRGGITIHPMGYRQILMPEHPRADDKGYVFEHIVVLEKKIGRSLLPNEHTHHINGNKLDNRPENLINMINSDHTAYHMKGNQYHRKNKK